MGGCTQVGVWDYYHRIRRCAGYCRNAFLAVLTRTYPARLKSIDPGNCLGAYTLTPSVGNTMVRTLGALPHALLAACLMACTQREDPAASQTARGTTYLNRG